MTKLPDPESQNSLPAGLSAPARRALAAAGVERLEQLARFSESEVMSWHGIGPNALAQLRRALSDRQISFAEKAQK